MNTFLEDFNTSEQRAVVKLVCENSLKAYIKLVHYYTTGSKFVFKPFHNEVIQKLEDIAFYRSTKNLLLNLPVGFGKSAIVEYFKSWCFARNKNICFLYTSYSDKLIVKLSSEIMEIMNSEIYKTLWGYTFKKDKKSKANWSIEGAVGRAGLTAGSIGGTVTGLDAGNPAIDGFCGALVCFPYDEQVWTNKGKLKIGDIVENKLDVKIYSYNHDKKHIELQTIEAYVKNNGDDIVRVTMKNGESFECTKNHRVWTINRGYVEAKDLIGGIDIVISLPNALNLVQGKSSIRDDNASRVVFIPNEFQKFIIKFYLFSWFIFNIACKSLKRFTSFDSLNSTYTAIKSFGNFSIWSFVLGYFNYVLTGKVAMRKNQSANFNSIFHIIGFSAIGKIFKTVIKGVRIKMSNLDTFFLFTDKGLHNKLMNIGWFRNSIFTKVNFIISSIINNLFKWSFFKKISTTFQNWIFNPVCNSFYISIIRYLINTLIVRDILIDNITFIGHEHNSYCLTVHNNHNMFVGKNQGFLVKNCDDPMKAGDEIYETKRDLVTEYFDRKLVTRLRRSDVPIIIVMQRLHEEDLTGYIKREGKYGSGLTKEQKESWKDNWDCVTVRALENEKSIWEEKVSTKTLIEERDRSPFVFYPQRQQEPNSNLNTHFKGLQFESNVKRIYNGIGHVDKAFGGEDSTAFTIANRVAVYDDDGNYIKDDIIMLGKKWDKHIDECIEEINALAEKYRCGTVYTENNDDKGYTAKNNDNFAMYHEHQNKHYKIMTYLYSNWKDIKFLEETDEDYIRQIQSYNEKSKHDDCPDSASSVIRLLEGEGVSVVSGIMV